MIKLKDLLIEGKISNDVERAARKLGIKFVKKTKLMGGVGLVAVGAAIIILK